MMLKSRITGIALLALALTVTQGARGSGEPPKTAKLFDSVETLELSMTAPWRELVRNDHHEGSYPATLEYTDEMGQSRTIELTVERRGVNRQRVCRIPPIKLRFEKKAVKGTAFRGQDSLKMVTHCQSAERYEQFYILEMLAYRMYNLLTDYSFRVRPLTVTYFQVESGEEEQPRFSFLKKKKSEGPVFAFLIEEAKDVANRHDAKNLHIPKIRPTQLDADETALFTLFQYMIGNVDWAATRGPDPEECCHNTKLIGPEPTQPSDILFAIPYDFDASGLVDSDYAVPPEGLPIRRVTQRLYRGYCAHNSALESARSRMLASEQAIYALVREENRLDSRHRDKALAYLGDFFETIRNERAFEKQIIGNCR